MKPKPILNFKDNYKMHVVNSYRFSDTSRPLIVTVKTDNAGTSADNQMYLPIFGTNMRIKTSEQDITVSAPTTLEWVSAGTYTIAIYGLDYIKFNNMDDKLKLLTLDQWGNTIFTAFDNAFYGCTNLTGNYTDVPNTTSVTSFLGAFYNCSNFNSPVTFDTSAALNTGYMFANCAKFNQPVDAFNMSNVTNASWMFRGCTLFNQPVNGWNTGNITVMSNLFDNCINFNQPLNNWNTSKVTTMAFMFGNCDAFNQNLNSFDFSKVLTLQAMFYTGATLFNNAGVSINWNTTVCTNFYYTFACPALNVPITLQTGAATTFLSMFQGCATFNSALTLSDTSKVASFKNMFNGCTNFNQSVSSLDTINATDISSMFASCSAFNQSVSSFNTAKVTNVSGMFSNCSVFNQAVSSFDTANVLTFKNMFYNCSVFNQSVSSFNTAKATSMAGMFYQCTNFDQDVSNFDTSLVSSLYGMFYQCTNFDRNIATFDISLVGDIGAFMNGVTLSTANYDAVLVAWELFDLINDLSVHFGSSKYTTAGETAKNAIIAADNWAFTDGGLAA